MSALSKIYHQISNASCAAFDHVKKHKQKYLVGAVLSAATAAVGYHFFSSNSPEKICPYVARLNQERADTWCMANYYSRAKPDIGVLGTCNSKIDAAFNKIIANEQLDQYCEGSLNNFWSIYFNPYSDF